MKEFSILDFAGIEFPFCISYGVCTISSLHTHDFTELTIVTDGSADHIVEGNEYSMSKGEVFTIVPPFAHEFRNVKNLIYYNIIFDLEKLMLVDNDLKRLPGFQALFILGPSYRYSHNFTSRMVLDKDQLAHVEFICRNIRKEFVNQEEGYKVIIKSYFLYLISFLSRYLLSEKEGISEKVYKIAETVIYIEENFAEKITLGELSQMAFLSERQYSRIFKEVYNVSPIDYVITCRLQHACRLIQSTQLSIREIAEQCGLHDDISLSRIFRHRYGMSPGQYRKIDR